MNNNDLRIIRRINAEAQAKFLDKLFVDEEKAPAMKEVLEKSLTKERGRFSETALDKLQAIKDSGILEGTQRVEDPKVAQQWEEYVGGRIQEEIKKGNLTNPDQAIKKSKQYARRAKKD